MRGVWEQTDNDIDVQILLLMHSLSHCCDEKDWGEVLATGFQRGVCTLQMKCLCIFVNANKNVMWEQG